jgi:hypothetical protein
LEGHLESGNLLYNTKDGKIIKEKKGSSYTLRLAEGEKN